MKSFWLNIEVGNDQMSDACDVAWALRQVADKLERDDFVPFHRPIHDINGNQVGTYKYNGGRK